ncbi:MAG: hypothetical protein DIU61_016445 [Bacteroidota bacterium]
MMESPFKTFRRLTPEGDSLAYDFASGWLIVESCEEVEPRQGETITSSPPSEPVDAPPTSFDNMPKPYEPKPDPFGDERSEDGHESGTLENGGIGNQVPVIDLPHGYPGEQTTRLDTVRYAIASTTALAFEIGNLDEDEINEILSAFVDANHIPPEFRREVAAAVKYGLIDGGPENSLGIFDIVTEEEINLILARAAEAEQRILSQPSNDHAVETTPEPRGPGTGAGSRAPVSRSMLRLMGGLLAGTVVLTIVFLYKYKK